MSKFQILGGWPAPAAGGAEYYRSLDQAKKNLMEAAKKPSDLRGLVSSTIAQDARRKHIQFHADTVIADIGCGMGGLEVLVLLSGKPFQKIYAVDIEPNGLEMLRFILDRYFPGKASKVEIVHSLPNDVKLPEQSVDVAVLNDAHFFVPRLAGGDTEMKSATSCLASLRKAMKPGSVVHVRQSIAMDKAPARSGELIHEPEVLAEFAQIIEIFHSAGFKISSQAIDEECQCFALALQP